MPRFAYLLAVDEYSDPRLDKTPYCHRDADLLYNALTEALDYEADKVVVRRVTPADDLTPLAIVDEVEQLLNGTGPEDTFLFYFAGHGTLSGQTCYLVLPGSDPDDYRNSALAVDAVDSVLRKDRRFCIRVLDACHSGVEPMKSRGSSALDNAGFLSELRGDPARGWVTFASCDCDQRSFWDEGKQHGAYTLSLCGAIQDLEDNEALDVLQLQQELIERMRAWSSENRRLQTPTLMGAIPGEQIIGVRRQRQVQASPPAAQEPDFTERLAIVRRLPVPGTEEIEHLRLAVPAALREFVTQVCCYDSVVGPPTAADAEGLSGELKRAVVQDIESKQWRTPFPCYTQYVPDRYSFPSMLSPYAARGEKSYVFSPGEYPTLFAELRVVGAYPLPGASLVVVALPLQTTIYIVSGTTVAPSTLLDESKSGLKLHYYWQLSPKEAIAWDARRALTATAAMLTERYEAAARDIVAYLERERSK